MKKHDKRTREQRKADESAMFAAGCLGLTLILIGIALLLTGCSLVLLSADAKDGEDPAEPGVEAYNSAWDKPATEYAYCDDVFLGEFTATAYCACVRCCGKEDGITATGTQATEGRTIAVDPDIIPYGSHVLLIWPDGTQHTYIAEDCGGSINGNSLDVYFDSHEAARQFGVQSVMAYLEVSHD